MEPRRRARACLLGTRTRNSTQKAMDEELMEQVVTQDNATAAGRAVKRNGGAPGIDGMTTQPELRNCGAAGARVS